MPANRFAISTGRFTIGMAALALTGPTLAQDAPAHSFGEPLPQTIARTDAQALVDAALADCEARGEPATAMVVDEAGAIRSMASSDGASWAGLHSAPGKTATVLAFKESTHALFDRMAKEPDFAASYKDDKRYFFHPGGAPLYLDGIFVGAFAVGGGHDKDEACVSAAIEKVGKFAVTP